MSSLQVLVNKLTIYFQNLHFVWLEFEANVDTQSRFWWAVAAGVATLPQRRSKFQQARREPQRGLRKHCCGALWQSHSDRNIPPTFDRENFLRPSPLSTGLSFATRQLEARGRSSSERARVEAPKAPRGLGVGRGTCPPPHWGRVLRRGLCPLPYWHPLIYSCWHRRWRQSVVLHLSIPDLRRTYVILEFHISFPITGIACTRFTGRTSITWNVCSVSVVISLQEREIVSARNWPTERFWKWTISFMIDCILTVEHCVTYTYNWNWNWNWKKNNWNINVATALCQSL